MSSVRHLALHLQEIKHRWMWGLLREGWADRFEGVCGN